MKLTDESNQEVDGIIAKGPRSTIGDFELESMASTIFSLNFGLGLSGQITAGLFA